MSGLDTDSAKIKKSILLRYPYNIFEEASRQLIIYKTFRGNNKRFKALMTMDELIDFCTYDIVTYERVYSVSDENKERIIPIPKVLVDAFKRLFHGDANGWMERTKNEWVPGMIYLSPSTSGMSPKDDLVYIRKAVPFDQVWGDKPEQYQIAVGFAYKKTASGELVAMVSKKDPSYEGTMTFTLPYGVFTEWFDRGWRNIAPICTTIEKTIAQTLEARGIIPESGFADDGSEGLDDSAGEVN